VIGSRGKRRQFDRLRLRLRIPAGSPGGAVSTISARIGSALVAGAEKGKRVLSEHAAPPGVLVFGCAAFAQSGPG
jgi:hypothetical protein